MIDKVKKVLHDKSMRLGVAATMAASAILPFAGASAGEADSGVVTAITGAADSLKGDAVKVIGVAVTIGILFFGAKLLWSKFKGMAK